MSGKSSTLRNRILQIINHRDFVLILAIVLGLLLGNKRDGSLIFPFICLLL